LRASSISCLVELQQGLLAHEHAVDDFAVEQLGQGFEHDGLAALGDQFHAHVAGAVERHGLFTVVEVAMVHVGDVRARRLAPLGHAVRVLARVFLDRAGGAAVGVAFAQHRVHGTADALAVARPQGLVFFGLDLFRIVRDGVALALEFLDAGLELGHRRADVGQLDDVGLRLQGQLAQFGQGVRHTLRLGQAFREGGQHARGHRDVAGVHVDAGRCGEGTDDGQEGARCQQRCLVGQGVDDGGLLLAHGLSPGIDCLWEHRRLRQGAVGRAACWPIFLSAF
jgi:hypothetical protein